MSYGGQRFLKSANTHESPTGSRSRAGAGAARSAYKSRSPLTPCPRYGLNQNRRPRPRGSRARGDCASSAGAFARPQPPKWRPGEIGQQIGGPRRKSDSQSRMPLAEVAAPVAPSPARRRPRGAGAPQCRTGGRKDGRAPPGRAQLSSSGRKTATSASPWRITLARSEKT
jgi:hypothetical protein